MTCIVGYIDEANNDIYIGGDSAGIAVYDIRVRKDPKVFIKNDFIIGYTSSFRIGQLIRYRFKPPKYIPELHGDVFEYMCSEFIDSLRKCFTAGGYAKNISGEEVGGFS